MIENDSQLLVTMQYLSKWANALEGMRLSADETSPNFFSQGAMGPLAEMRKGLDEARRYLENRLHITNDSTQSHSNGDGATAQESLPSEVAEVTGR
jgi:hypothetical protein